MSVQIPLELDQESIAGFCRKHGVKKLSLFGSVLRGDFSASSDVDVLVEFASDRTPDYFTVVDMEDELSFLMGRRVDLRTANELSRYFRDDVVGHAAVQYAE